MLNILFFINMFTFIKMATEVCLHAKLFLVDHKSLIKTTLRKLGLCLGLTQTEAFEV